MGTGRGGRRIERAGPADLMFLALQRATVPEQFGVVLVLDPDGPFDAAAAVRLVASRIPAVPRLRQRIQRVPPGCGRPIWVDDAGFAVERHIDVVACAPPGGETEMLAAAAELLLAPLPPDRPLWAARFITGLAGGRVALVVVAQHALADGVGGLAVLGTLVDGSLQLPDRGFPVPAPSRRELAAQAWTTRVHGLSKVPEMLRHRPHRKRQEAHSARVGRASPCSLLATTGRQRRVTVATGDLEAIRASAHLAGATVNDALVSAVAGALHTCLQRRGEDPPALVLAVPVAVRRGTTADDVGNAFTEARARVPGGGATHERLERVAGIMQERKAAVMQPAALFVAAPAVRAMVGLGFYGWYMRRQRYLHTVLTNLRGPGQRVTLAGAPIVRMLPLAVGGGGNVTVTFAAISYAGTLAVTVTADPTVTPDLGLLTADLQAELGRLGG